MRKPHVECRSSGECFSKAGIPRRAPRDPTCCRNTLWAQSWLIWLAVEFAKPRAAGRQGLICKGFPKPKDTKVPHTSTPHCLFPNVFGLNCYLFHPFPFFQLFSWNCGLQNCVKQSPSPPLKLIHMPILFPF